MYLIILVGLEGEGLSVVCVDEKAKEVIEKALGKMGGRKRLGGVRDMTVIRRHASFEDIIKFRAPNRISRESNFPWASLKIGFDGANSWYTTADGSVVVEKGRSPAVQWLFHYIDTLLLVRILDADARVEYQGGKKLLYFRDEEMFQKPVSLVRVTFDDDWVFRLYFCRESGLLVREEYRHATHQTRYIERFFDRYTRSKHILLPRRIYELNPHSKAIKRIRVKYEINTGLHRRSFRAPKE